MLTPELQKEIDEKWNASWPLCQLKPIVILDLISYIFFVKKISSDQLTDFADQRAGKKTDKLAGSILAGANGKKEQFAADFFNEPDDKNMYALLTDPTGIAGLEKEYSLHPAYGIFIKGGLLMHPTSKLLDTSLGILRIINNADYHIKGEIFCYLLSKAQYIDGNGHVYLPPHLVDLLVAIIRPRTNDVVLNPTLGNGNILVSCAKYLAGNNDDSLIYHTESQKLKGLASDITSLRIGAMNLSLNGISTGGLKALDVFAPLNSFSDVAATVILSNLIFLNSENNDMADGNARRDATRKDIYYMEFILKNLNEGTRCAIVVPGLMSYHTGSEFINIRRELIDNLKWSALISIDDKNNAEFNGGSILVFSKEAACVTDKVWFCQLKQDGLMINEDDNLLTQTDAIITHLMSNGKTKDSGCGFYVDADEIRAKNYNFSFSEYSFLEKEKVPRQTVVTIKPGGFPKLGAEVTGKSISYLQPASAPPIEIKKAPPTKAPKPKKIFNREVFKIEKRIPPVLLKKLPTKKMGFVAGSFILLFAIGYLFYSVLFSGREMSHKNKTSTLATAEPDKAASMRSIDSVVNSMNSYLLKDSDNNRVKSYTVISKAYFYSSPNIGNPIGKYLTSSGGGVLASLKEENGFVYVNYINSKGRSTKGWLNKNDLEEAGTDAAEIVPVETKQEAAVEKKANDESTGEINNAATKYLVKTKAYFYSEPDINSRLNLYLNKPNHSRLSPLEEKNGFVYVIYRNSRGKITRGWLNKKDLGVVQE